MDPTQLLNRALQHLGTDVPTAQNLIRIAVQLAQSINTATGLSGREKLDHVIRTLRELLAVPAVAERLTPAQRDQLLSVVNDVIPETISLVVEASRGAYQLKKPSVGCVAHWAALLCRAASVHGPAQFQAVTGQIAGAAAAVEQQHSEKEPPREPVAEPKELASVILHENTTDNTAPPAGTISEPAASPSPSS